MPQIVHGELLSELGLTLWLTHADAALQPAQPTEIEAAPVAAALKAPALTSLTRSTAAVRPTASPAAAPSEAKRLQNLVEQKPAPKPATASPPVAPTIIPVEKTVTTAPAPVSAYSPSAPNMADKRDATSTTAVRPVLEIQDAGDLTIATPWARLRRSQWASSLSSLPVHCVQPGQGSIALLLESPLNEADQALLQRMLGAIELELAAVRLLVAGEGPSLRTALEGCTSGMVLASLPETLPRQALDHLRKQSWKLDQTTLRLSYHPVLVRRSADARGPSWEDWRWLRSQINA